MQVAEKILSTARNPRKPWNYRDFRPCGIGDRPNRAATRKGVTVEFEGSDDS